MTSERSVSPVKAAELRQRTASDPALNAFVSANAGSGKTKVLVDRVIRLLLAGAAPERILCLTYTKAAASEMQARLFRRLGAWSVSADAELARDLDQLAPERAHRSADTLRDARALFARALETPGGLKVQTIHAFCERLLRRFPVEAGVPTGFEVLEDADAARLVQGARGAVAGLALDGGPLADAFAALAARANDEAVDAFLDWAAGERAGLRAWFASAGGFEGARRALYARLGVADNETEADAKAAAWAAAPRADLEAAARAFMSGGKSDQSLGAMLAKALEAADPETAYDLYAGLIFTATKPCPPRKSYANKATVDAHPFLTRLFGSHKDGYGAEVARMTAAREQVRAAALAEITAAGLMIAEAFVRAYEAAKARAAALDFTDLVEAARALLSTSEAAQWVLYKLDGGVDHILVDEAQDTAPPQWDVINAVTSEFFAGAGARESLRTAFAVGDEKQSIYSFQGAEPARFLEETQKLAAKSHAAGATFRTVPFEVSFRSAPAILKAVDETFASAELAEALLPDREPPGVDVIAHAAARADIAGYVECWPLIEGEDAAPALDPFAPVDAPAPDHPRERLARVVADAVRGWLDAGEAVSEEEVSDGVRRRQARALRPGDVMILVRRRGALFEALIRRLKAAGVPVAGADRMTLSAELAVEDLLGAARVGLLPEDDLALAEFLKCPFLHPQAAASPPIDDDALFAIAHGREGRLVAALRASEAPRFDEAKTLVDALVETARRETPFGFLAGLLDRPSASGETYAKRLYARLGPEAEDAVKELLSRALAHERRGAPSLDRFVRETLFDNAAIKRETAGARDEVRVMTVHAAKGLEAPVVILPDAADAAEGRRSLAPLEDPDAGYLWSLAKSDDPPPAQRAREARERAARGEDLRLLYVAMTRACDRLVVCGAASKRSNPATSWHGLVEAALGRLEAARCDTPAGPEGLVYGAAPGVAPSIALTKAAAPERPAWVDAPAPPARAAERPRAPALGFSERAFAPAGPSPLAAGGEGRFRRGALIHALLQRLPDLAPERRADAARAYLSREGVDAAMAETLIAEVDEVLAYPGFAPAFAPGSRAEVPIAGTAPGLPEGYLAAGRIDRLAVTDDAVFIVDFKTNRTPPARACDIERVYLEQMAIYRELIRAIHPDKDVRCALAWTDGPRLTPLSDALLDAALILPEQVHT